MYDQKTVSERTLYWQERMSQDLLSPGLIGSTSQVRRPPRYQPMVLCVLAMSAGIALDGWLDVDYRVFLSTVLLGLIGWCLLQNRSWIAGASRRAETSYANWRRESLASACLLIGLLGLGGFWHHGRWNWFSTAEIGTFANEDGAPCCVEAVATSEPRWLSPNESNEGLDYQKSTTRTRITVRVQQIRDADQWRPATGKIDLTIRAPTTHVCAGDRLRVYGLLVRIGPPTNPGQFDFQWYYRAQSKLATLHVDCPEAVQVIEPAGSYSPQLLSLLRRRLNEFAWHYINADEAAFASAIMLGNREQLSAERRAAFLKTGTSHLLSISGLHVGILAGCFYLFFRLGWLSRRNCLFATIAFVIFYCWLVEFLPPVSRATVLIVLFCVGRLLGESSFTFNLLALAGLFVLLINPLDLFHLGAQLSFLAVGTLNFGKEWMFWPPPRDPIQRLIASTRPWPIRTLNWCGRQTRSAILVSIVIWCVAMPLVAYRFHLVAPVALIVNPLLILPIAWGLYSGLGVMVFGQWFPPAAYVCGKFCEWNLALSEWLIGLGEAVPYGYFWTSGPTLTATLSFYVGLFFFAVFPPTHLRLRWIVVLAIGWLVGGWWLPDQIASYRQRHRANPLICTFIDVGHGTSVLLQMPDGTNLLYDAGSFGSSTYGYQSVAGVLWSARIDFLDRVVISHADIDHFNALPELSRRFRIGEVIVSPKMLASSAPAVRTLFSRLAAEQIPVRTMFAETPANQSHLLQASLKIPPHDHETNFAALPANTTILSPPQSGTGGTDNSDSIVLLVEHAGKKILLPGDLESEGMGRLLAREPIDCSLVMAPHHGSMNSDPTEFMQWSTPESVVISGGHHRIRESVVRVFAADDRIMFRTDQHGAVRYRIADDQTDISTWDRHAWRSQVRFRPK